MKSIINRPHHSPWIITLYTGMFILALLATLTINILGAMILAAIITIIMFIHLIAIVYTKYHITPTGIIFYSLYGKKTIPFKTIKSMKRVRHREMHGLLRYFGSSCHAGYHWHAHHKHVFMTITNYRELILIKTKSRFDYLLSPSEPNDFIKEINKRKKKS